MHPVKVFYKAFMPATAVVDGIGGTDPVTEILQLHVSRSHVSRSDVEVMKVGSYVELSAPTVSFWKAQYKLIFYEIYQTSMAIRATLRLP